VGRGDFAQQVPIATRDEFGDLSRDFNQMTERLQMSRRKLELTVQSLQDTRARLVQSEKLSAVGEFIAGVAHELNNPLTIMVGFAQMLEESELADEHREELQQICQSAERCHKVVQNLLGFARQRPPERTAVDVNVVLETTVTYMNYELRTSNIRIEKSFGQELPAVLADPHQLQQIFLNIVNNARQAMVEARIEGIIRFTTSSQPGGVRIMIEDTGPGIPPEHIEKLFDPFFTTKAQGQGTGLGLSVSYGLIKEHDGDIHVSSRVGEGTCFTIELPAAPFSEQQTLAEPPRPPQQMVTEGKIVLIVDDEEHILQLSKKMLARQGFHVLTTQRGEDALALLKSKVPDLILCDWRMPGMNGEEFYRRVRESYPQLANRFIFITGDVLNTRMQAFIDESGASIIAKPFSLDEFRATIQVAVQH